MTKREAIDSAANKTKIPLNGRNTIFANVGIHKDSWWLEPANDKLKIGFYFILNDEIKRMLLLFKVPPNTLKESQFRQRDEKGVSQIIIPISNSKYVDRRGFDFTNLLINQISY